MKPIPPEAWMFGGLVLAALVAFHWLALRVARNRSRGPRRGAVVGKRRISNDRLTPH